MARNRNAHALAAALLLAALSAAAKEAKTMDWKTEKTGLFRCDIPSQWDSEDLTEGEGSFFSGGRDTIVARRASGTPEEFLKKFNASGDALKRSTTTVSGRAAERVVRRYENRTGGGDSPSHSRWVYEETVLLPGGKGSLWVLTYRSSSAAPSEPQSLEVWKRFLKSFRPS